MRRLLPTLCLLVLAVIVLGSRPSAPAATSAGPIGPDRDTTLVIPGLTQPVELITDRSGIPHLHARTYDDLYLAWGFVTARDRLWELAYTRRQARGDLWQWQGNRVLRSDGGAQLFEIATRADAIWRRDKRDPAVKRTLERFADGVNAYIALCRSGARPWPIELRRLGKTPEDWRPQDSYLLLLAQGFVLDFELPELVEDDSIRAHGAEWVAARQRFENDWMVTSIPDSAARRMYGGGGGTTSAIAPPTPGALADLATTRDARTGDMRRPASELKTSSLAAARATVGPWLDADRQDPEARASDVFAVGPRRAERGRPLFANDPHLGLASPSALYVIHVVCDQGAVNAVGATLPGLPAIVSGRNRRAAWGITALSGDCIDVYADSLSADGKQVRWPGGSAPIREADYTMRYRALGVLDVPPFGQTRRYTPHGPVIVYDRKRGLALSVKWAGHDQDISMSRLLGVERSSSAAELTARYRTLVTPTLNVVAADVDGHVRYQTVGAMPRRGFAPLLGLTPGDGRHEWLGQIAADSMPAWDVPADGFVVNGNNLPVGRAYPEPLPRFGWRHDRAHRMNQRLAGDARVTMADMASVQNDVVSFGAATYTPLMLGHTDSTRGTLSPAARAALDTLSAWRFETRRWQHAPTLYRAWFNVFMRRSGLEGMPGLAAAALDGRAPEALRDPRSGEVEPAAHALAAALDSALAQLTVRLGADPVSWTWGRAHRARFAHGLARTWSDLEPPTIAEDGDNSTPSVGASRLPWDVRVNHGPVWRHVVDLADSTRSWGVLPPGNAGEGPHAHDLMQRWANHGYVPLDLDWDRVRAARESAWTLSPAGGSAPPTSAR